MRRSVLELIVIAGLVGVRGPFAAADDTARGKHAAEPAAEGGMPKLKLSKGSLANLNEPALGVEINAGVIARARLRAELARGIGQFLRQVRTEPAFTHGRFVGWRVLELFPRRADIRVLVLRPGDTVIRVNGHAVERPEDFKSVWDSLADARELILDIQRDARPSRLRYAIAD